MKTQRRHAAAFTLIEIMMVVAILGLTFSMGMPPFIKFSPLLESLPRGFFIFPAAISVTSSW